MNNSNTTVPTGIASSPLPTTLLDTCAANGSFKTFGKAVEHAGLGESLSGIGPFTIFAPTDAAFDRLPSGKLDELFRPENRKELASVVNYHVLEGRKPVAEIGKWSAARTRQGQSAPITLTGDRVSIDGAQVTTADIVATNGVIHGIDKVNLPTPQ